MNFFQKAIKNAVKLAVKKVGLNQYDLFGPHAVRPADPFAYLSEPMRIFSSGILKPQGFYLTEHEEEAIKRELIQGIISSSHFKEQVNFIVEDTQDSWEKKCICYIDIVPNDGDYKMYKIVK